MKRSRISVIILLVLFGLSACSTPDAEEATTAVDEELPVVVETAAPPPIERPVGESPTARLSLSTPVPSVTATATPLPEPTVQPSQTPTATPTPAGKAVTSITLQPVASGFSRPTYLTHAGDERLFVVEQVGRVWIIEEGNVNPSPFLDIEDRVGSQALEQGLLSITFHPQYRQNGILFVYYTDTNGDVAVARYHVRADDPDQADLASESLLLAINQPFANHNGGQLVFGPDGYLYIGVGDGGSAGDPANNGQNPGTLLGTLLRIGVDGGQPYTVPEDNPLVGDGSALAEIWAFGLRNPWRFSFDKVTGDLYVADVGQNNWEEINFQPAGSPGGANYGWNILEGSHCYLQPNCDAVGMTSPVTEYSHQEGGCSVSGGYVYRGERHSELTGNYFFGDFCTGIIWSLFRQPGGEWVRNLVARSGLSISSFGQDNSGELYVLDHGRGVVYRIEP